MAVVMELITLETRTNVHVNNEFTRYDVNRHEVGKADSSWHSQSRKLQLQFRMGMDNTHSP